MDFEQIVAKSPDEQYQAHLGVLFSETMNFKFHMQHDQTAGLQPCRESKIAAILKVAKPFKLTFSPEWLRILD